jgi:ribosomal protein L11 methylase PrmA
LLIDFCEYQDNAVKSQLDSDCWKILNAERVPFISYPYEWSFSQLKDAALLTLDLQELAMHHGMTLKDASAYNVQFIDNRPIFIDILSFEKYVEGQPWIAYGQFCRHFLSPLLLARYIDINFIQILEKYIDGIPITMPAKMLPVKCRFSLQKWIHVYVHANLYKKYEKMAIANKQIKLHSQNKNISQNSIQNLITSLKELIGSINLPNTQTLWSNYYNNTNYTDAAFAEKKRIVEQWLNILKPSTVVDIGANTGEFSKIASDYSDLVVSLDMDPLAVAIHYTTLRNSDVKNVLPLVVNIATPTPSIGWRNQERQSFLARCNADTILALAITHHLRISNNITLQMQACFFSSIAKSLIIEFVPKEDDQTVGLLSGREDIFNDYTLENFIDIFMQYYKDKTLANIPGTYRSLLMFSNN